MTGYTFTITCRHCGGQLTHTADGVVRPDATTALATCGDCQSLYRLDLRVSVLNGPAVRHTMPAEVPRHPVIAAIMAAERDLLNA